MAMNFTVPQTTTGGTASGFGEAYTRAVSTLITHLFEYAEYKPQKACALISFAERAVDPFYMLNGELVEPLTLHQLPKYKFDGSLQRRELFLHYLTTDVQKVEEVFATHHKAAPRRLWAVQEEGKPVASALDYSPASTTLPEMGDASALFRTEVFMGVWPKPLMGYSPAAK